MTNSNSADAMAAFLAQGGKITNCGSTMKQARSLRAMRDEDQANLDSIDFRRNQALAIESRNAGYSREE